MTTRIRIGKQTELSTLAGSLVVTDLSNEQEYLAPGALGDVLTSNGPGVLPSYQTPTTGGDTTYWVSTNTSALGTLTRFQPVGGGAGLSVAETDVQAPMVAGTVNMLKIVVVSNASTGNTTIDFRVNGASVGPTITVPAAATGVFTDTTSTAINTDDLVNIRVTNAGVGAILIGGFTTRFIPS